MTPRTEFLVQFYKTMGICGFAGLLVSWLFVGWPAAASFALGFLSISLIIFLWDITLMFTLKKKKTSWAWETFLVFVRYILLGGLFYAMISLLDVRWFWYIVGTTTILPSLLITTFVVDR